MATMPTALIMALLLGMYLAVSIKLYSSQMFQMTFSIGAFCYMMAITLVMTKDVMMSWVPRLGLAAPCEMALFLAIAAAVGYVGYNTFRSRVIA